MSDTAKLVCWCASLVAVVVLVALPVDWSIKIALAVLVGAVLGVFGRSASRRGLWR